MKRYKVVDIVTCPKVDLSFADEHWKVKRPVWGVIIPAGFKCVHVEYDLGKNTATMFMKRIGDDGEEEDLSFLD